MAVAVPKGALPASSAPAMMPRVRCLMTSGLGSARHELELLSPDPAGRKTPGEYLKPETLWCGRRGHERVTRRVRSSQRPDRPNGQEHHACQEKQPGQPTDKAEECSNVTVEHLWNHLLDR